ncbi:MAG: hypothetical protein Q8916_06740 [Bacteroidota bacterium]|nr:hypothetical protein [Bacteroidota bacterium]MDP4230088.1 hypothetical protein [Bacteroidota bacterium]MDP4236161.1 hypothetical protein [Bacteroidota bacterium]
MGNDHEYEETEQQKSSEVIEESGGPGWLGYPRKNMEIVLVPQEDVALESEQLSPQPTENGDAVAKASKL